jgi:hypothetical protein
MAWDSTVPTTGTKIIDIPAIFTGNWHAFDEILEVQHYGHTSELSGRHIAGRTAVLCSDATTGITGMTPPGSGALAFDTTLGTLRAYFNSTWMLAANLPKTSIKAYVGTGDQSIPSDGATIQFDTEAEDTLNEFNTTTYTFSPCAAGFFNISVTLSILDAGGITEVISIKQYNSADVLQNDITAHYRALSSDHRSIQRSAIIYAAAGDKIKVELSHNRTTSIIVEAGAERSYLTITRLS